MKQCDVCKKRPASGGLDTLRKSNVTMNGTDFASQVLITYSTDDVAVDYCSPCRSLIQNASAKIIRDNSAKLVEKVKELLKLDALKS